MIKAVIELVRDGGSAAVWIIIICYVVQILKLLGICVCIYVTSSAVVKALMGTIKHAWDADLEITKIRGGDN